MWLPLLGDLQSWVSVGGKECLVAAGTSRAFGTKALLAEASGHSWWGKDLELGATPGGAGGGEDSFVGLRLSQLSTGL